MKFYEEYVTFKDYRDSEDASAEIMKLLRPAIQYRYRLGGLEKASGGAISLIGVQKKTGRVRKNKEWVDVFGRFTAIAFTADIEKDEYYALITPDKWESSTQKSVYQDKKKKVEMRLKFFDLAMRVAYRRDIKSRRAYQHIRIAYSEIVDAGISDPSMRTDDIFRDADKEFRGYIIIKVDKKKNEYSEVSHPFCEAGYAGNVGSRYIFIRGLKTNWVALYDALGFKPRMVKEWGDEPDESKHAGIPGINVGDSFSDSMKEEWSAGVMKWLKPVIHYRHHLKDLEEASNGEITLIPVKRPSDDWNRDGGYLNPITCVGVRCNNVKNCRCNEVIITPEEWGRYNECDDGCEIIKEYDEDEDGKIIKMFDLVMENLCKQDVECGGITDHFEFPIEEIVDVGIVEKNSETKEIKEKFYDLMREINKYLIAKLPPASRTVETVYLDRWGGGRYGKTRDGKYFFDITHDFFMNCFVVTGTDDWFSRYKGKEICTGWRSCSFAWAVVEKQYGLEDKITT